MPFVGPDVAVELLHVILWMAKQENFELTPIRVVKFLYLADLHFAQVHGRKLTDLKWRFFHFGPWCEESLEVINRGRTQPWFRARSYYSPYKQDEAEIYSLARNEDEPDLKLLPLQARLQLRDEIKRFGSDTHSLLDYVYFETEPMFTAEPDDILDFSTARVRQPARKVETLSIGKEDRARALDLIRSIAASNPRPTATTMPVELDAIGSDPWAVQECQMTLDISRAPRHDEDEDDG